jgi:hypothetical protein
MGQILRAARLRVRFVKMFVAAALGLAAIGGGAGRSAQAQNFSSPQAMLLAYYSAVNLRNYPKAYSYWLNPTQSYADFASGFLTTERVLPYFGAWQPAQASAPAGESGRIPAMLIGYHTDGAPIAFSGCFHIGFNTVQATSYAIVGANFTQIAAAGNVPDTNSISAALGVNCYKASSGVTPIGAIPLTVVDATPDKGQAMLEGYYRLINQRDFTNAYAEWLQPLPGPKPNGAPATDYRLPYADFVSGYADTVYVFAYLGAYSESGAAAGHSYLDGTISAVLVGYHVDGSVVAFHGCYVLGNLADGQLGIVSGQFTSFASPPDVPIGNAILDNLGVDCTTLDLAL